MFKKMSISLEQFLLRYGYAPSKSKRETMKRRDNSEARQILKIILLFTIYLLFITLS